MGDGTAPSGASGQRGGGKDGGRPGRRESDRGWISPGAASRPADDSSSAATRSPYDGRHRSDDHPIPFEAIQSDSTNSISTFETAPTSASRRRRWRGRGQKGAVTAPHFTVKSYVIECEGDCAGITLQSAGSLRITPAGRGRIRWSRFKAALTHRTTAALGVLQA